MPSIDMGLVDQEFFGWLTFNVEMIWYHQLPSGFVHKVEKVIYYLGSGNLFSRKQSLDCVRPFSISYKQCFIFLTDLIIYHLLSNTEVRGNFSIQFQLQWWVGSQGIFLVGGLEGISTISVSDIAVLALVAITFAEFTGLVMFESSKVIRCGYYLIMSTMTCSNDSIVAGIRCGRGIFWETLKVLTSESFRCRSATVDDIVARLPTFPAGFLEVEWAHDCYVSKWDAVDAVLMMIDR